MRWHGIVLRGKAQVQVCLTASGCGVGSLLVDRVRFDDLSDFPHV